MDRLSKVPYRVDQIKAFPDFTNKCQDFKQLAFKWVALNPEIQCEKVIKNRVFLLNLNKINKNTFYPLTDVDLSIIGCQFFGSNSGLGKERLRKYNKMIKKDLFYIEVV